VKCRSYIAGAWSDDTDNPLNELGHPADRRKIVSSTVYATPREAAYAVDSASKAWNEWRHVPVSQREAFVERVTDVIHDNADEFAQLIQSETGKTAAESRLEVDATIAEARGQIDLFRSSTVELINGHQVLHEPLGAVLLITPSNFPLAAVMRKLVPALLSGNTVVVKASELTPLTANRLFEILEGLGLLPGVVNLVLAEGRAVVPAMIEERGLRAISITGSDAAGESTAAAIGGRDIRYQAEMGGSNAVVVLADAELETAATHVVDHGFACCGQWCTGTTRVIIDASVYDEFTGMLLEKIQRISLGSATGMGPLISAAQLRRVEEAVDDLVDKGATVLTGGRRPDSDELAHGNYFEPTVLAGIDDYHSAADREIFGPVIVLFSAESIEDAVAIANAGQYGLSFSIFTGDPETAEQVVSAIDAGLCHINLPTGFRDSALPLSGWNRSGRGIPECGRFARDFFTRTKTVYRAS